MIYDVDYFIKKFEAIPEGRWIEGNYRHGTCACALGHCGLTDNSVLSGVPKARALHILLGEKTVEINDGEGGFYDLGTTPKERILNALRKVKNSTSKT